MKNHWLPVQVEDGMFSDEYAVKIVVGGNVLSSLFAEKKFIRQEGKKYLLRLSDNSIFKEKGNFKVLLPGEPVGGGSRWITVPKKELVYQ